MHLIHSWLYINFYPPNRHGFNILTGIPLSTLVESDTEFYIIRKCSICEETQYKLSGEFNWKECRVRELGDEFIFQYDGTIFKLSKNGDPSQQGIIKRV